MKDTWGIDTDEVKKNSSQKIQENEYTIHPSVDADPVGVAQTAGWRDWVIDEQRGILNGTVSPVTWRGENWRCQVTGNTVTVEAGFSQRDTIFQVVSQAEFKYSFWPHIVKK